MASINLSGVLDTSLGGFDVGGVIRFTHVSTTGDTLQHTIDRLIVPPDGSYDINLNYGNVRMDYIPSDEPMRFLAIVTVNQDSTATTLPELLNSAVPPTDAQLLLFQDILADTVQAKNDAEQAALSAVNAIKSFTLAEAVAKTDAIAGQQVRIKDRANGLFEYKPALIANGLDIIATVSGLFLEMVWSGTVNVVKIGAKGDGINDDYSAIARATEIAKEIFYPSPGVYYRTSQTIIVRSSQLHFMLEDWSDWFLAADQAKCIKPDSGVNAFSTIISGRSYPNNQPTSLEFRRNITFRNMHIQTDQASCVLHHYCNNFKYDGCVLRSNGSPAVPCRFSYRGNFNNCFISVSNYAGYAVQLYDNCNAVSFTGYHYSTNGVIAGAVDISKSQAVSFSGSGVYEINGLACIRVGGLTAAEAEYIEEVGNCNGISIQSRYFERCKEAISIGENSACLGVVIEGNSIFSYDDSDNYTSCISLGSCAGVTVRGNSFQKTGSVDFPTLLLRQVVGSTFRLPVKIEWTSNHTQRSDLTSGTDFLFDSSYPEALSGYTFGSSVFDFTNSVDIENGGSVNFKTHGSISTHTTREFTCSESNSINKYSSTDGSGGLIESIELVNITGSIDGTLRVGDTTNTAENLVIDLSTVSVNNNYAELSVTNQLIRPFRDLSIMHVQGSLGGKYQVKIRYRV